MTIGELAQRLRITTRTLRHYDQLGLLVPEHVDALTGYREYGQAQFVRAVQIEQLKATGLSLSTIGQLLDSDDDTVRALRLQRRQIEVVIAEHAAQLAAIDALLASGVALASPEVVEVPAAYVVVTHTTSEPDELSRTIRRAIQQLGRDTRQRQGVRCRSFSARFPLHIDDGPLPVEVCGHLDEPTGLSTVRPSETQLKVLLVGDISMVPLAYDVALTAVRQRGLVASGTVVEHYLDLASPGRTEVAIPLCV
jgi:DNA-binding transcriptional MerR regulator